jgi:hypothetical protein
MKIIKMSAVALLLSVLGAAQAFACTSCYGAADAGSPLISGARFGVFLLLGVTVAVLGAFVKFFLHLRNRARQAENEQITAEWAQFQRSSST